MIRVLVADDHPIILSGLEALFRDTGYEIVATANDGGQVMGMLDGAAPDVLILDERMPGLSGVEVLRALREEGDDRPVVLLTADLSDEAAVEGLLPAVEAAAGRMPALLVNNAARFDYDSPETVRHRGLIDHYAVNCAAPVLLARALAATASAVACLARAVACSAS